MQTLPGRSAQPHLRPLRRPDGSVQIGLGPRSVRLIGLTDAECRWLAAVDPAAALTSAVATAALEDIDPARATEVLDRLVTGGLLHPAPPGDLHHVAVVGSGALPALLVDVLGQSDRLHATRVRPGAEAEAPAVVAVLVSASPVAPDAAQPWLAAAVPVLPVWCLPDQASIGPLLRPGRGPCLHCLDLTRSGVDPGWPWLRAQLTRAHVTGPEPVDGLPAVRLLAAGLTTTLLLDHLGGRLTTPEWSFEVATPGPTLERHRWPAHPECPECGSPPLRALSTAPDDGAPSPGSGWSDTMAG